MMFRQRKIAGRRGPDRHLREPFMADAGIALTLLRGMRKSGIPVDGDHDVEDYLESLSDTERGDLYVAIKAVVERREKERAEIEALESPAHPVNFDPRPLELKITAAGTYVELDPAEVEREANRQRSREALAEARRQQRHDEAVSMLENREARDREAAELGPTGRQPTA